VGDDDDAQRLMHYFLPADETETPQPMQCNILRLDSCVCVYVGVFVSVCVYTCILPPQKH